MSGKTRSPPKRRFCKTSSEILEWYREPCDTILSGFKNNRIGKRRRRLDYGLARKVVIEALEATANIRPMDAGGFEPTETRHWS